MGSDTAGPITQLLLRWNSGEESCLGELIPLLEHELRLIAHRQMRKEREGHTLQTTALVNEAYLKLVDQSRANWQNRAQFLGVASGLMRRILVDHARGLCRAKRGGAAGHLPLDEELVFSPDEIGRSGCFGRCTRGTRPDGSAKGQGRGDALLRRAECGGSRRSAACTRQHDHPRLEFG